MVTDENEIQEKKSRRLLPAEEDPDEKWPVYFSETQKGSAVWKH